MPNAAQDSKKERELTVLSGFRKASGLQLRILDGRRETPDFLVEFEGRSIGIEVTEIFVPRNDGSLNPQARTSIGARIAQGAWKRYTELGGKPVHVSIHLTPHDTLRDINRDDAIEQLAQLVMALDPPLDQAVTWQQSYPYGPVPQEIFALHMLAVPSWDMAIWTAPEAGWVAPLGIKLIQDAVDEKAPLLTRYRSAASETWLVVAILGRSASQFFKIDAETPWSSVRSPFDRTYFLAGFEGRVERLGAT